MGSISKKEAEELIRPVLQEKAKKILNDMKMICTAEIIQRTNSLHSQLNQAEEILIEQLDSLMEEELSKTSGETPSEVRFLQSNLNHQSLANLIGFMVVDGVIPSYLSLNVMSRMVDFKVGATLNLVVESGPHVKDFWQRKIVVTVVNTDEEGKEKEVVCHQKTEDRKVLLWFEACPGINNVSVTLYGQHIDKSPFIIPIGRELEMDLASLGLCFLDKAGERAEKEWSVREIPAEQDWDELTSSSSSGLSQDEEYSSGEETRLEDAGSRTVDQKDEEMGEWKVGESCLAKWSKDGVWYNVEIKECLPRRRYLVRFTDYGNFDCVNEKEMVHSTSDIQDGDEVDENVIQHVGFDSFRAACSDIGSSDDSSLSLESDPEEPVTEKDLTQPEQVVTGPVSGSECSICELVAKKPQRLVCDGSLVCWNCAVKKITKDHRCWKCGLNNISTSNHLRKVTDKPAPTTLSGHLSLTALLRGDNDGGRFIPVVCNLRVTDIGDTVRRLEALEDGSFIALIGSELIKFSHEGRKLGSRKVKTVPTGFLVRQSGEIRLMDVHGVKVFNQDLQLRKEIPIPLIDCEGMAEDKFGNLITINVNKSGSKITKAGSSSIFVIDVVGEHLGRVIDLEEIIESAKDFDKRPGANSSIGFVAFKKDVFYIVDSGLNCVYVVCEKGSSATMFGTQGQALQLHRPNSLVVDEAGNMIVADNGKMQVVSNDQEFLGVVKVDQPLFEPCLLHLDEKKREMYVFNKGSRSILRYKM